MFVGAKISDIVTSSHCHIFTCHIVRSSHRHRERNLIKMFVRNKINSVLISLHLHIVTANDIIELFNEWSLLTALKKKILPSLSVSCLYHTHRSSETDMKKRMKRRRKRMTRRRRRRHVKTAAGWCSVLAPLLWTDAPLEDLSHYYARSVQAVPGLGAANISYHNTCEVFTSPSTLPVEDPEASPRSVNNGNRWKRS